MVIQSFLQLSPGVFSIFYHENLAKTSSKKADDRAFSFILGVEICVAIVFLTIYIITNFVITKNSFPDALFFYILSGILALEAILTFFFYFRPSKKAQKSSGSTKLFLPRYLAASLVERAGSAKNRSDGVLLGIISTALELFFTLPLYIMASISIFYISPNTGFVFIIAYIIIATVPLFAIRTFYHADHNLAEIQRARVKRKFAVKIVIAGCFLALAIITLIIGGKIW